MEDIYENRIDVGFGMTTKYYICKECNDTYDYMNSPELTDSYVARSCSNRNCVVCICMHIYEKDNGLCMNCSGKLIIKKLEKENKELKKKIELLENHIRFAPDGEGALEALNSFLILQKII